VAAEVGQENQTARHLCPPPSIRDPKSTSRLETRQSISFKTTVNMAPAAYIISRAADPFFALAIGLSAAAMRISREEKEKGKTTQQTLDSVRR